MAAVSVSEPSRALASRSTRPADAARTALQARPAGRALVQAALGNGDPRSPNPVGAKHGDPLAVTAWRAGGRRGVTARAAWIGTRPARPCLAAPHRRAPPRRGPRIRADDRGVERTLIVLAKSPVPGRVNTRLCPPKTRCVLPQPHGRRPTWPLPRWPTPWWRPGRCGLRTAGSAASSWVWPFRRHGIAWYKPIVQIDDVPSAIGRFHPSTSVCSAPTAADEPDRDCLQQSGSPSRATAT